MVVVVAVVVVEIVVVVVVVAEVVVEVVRWALRINRHSIILRNFILCCLSL